MYASFLGISEALHLDVFHQPLRSQLFDFCVLASPEARRAYLKGALK